MGGKKKKKGQAQRPPKPKPEAAVNEGDPGVDELAEELDGLEAGASGGSSSLSDVLSSATSLDSPESEQTEGMRMWLVNDEPRVMVYFLIRRYVWW